ncbi:hypothetical protein TcCL_Unassigned01558 [Trypanosoma cruzi]|nr:hypothetical protein TcCL_Unassigned01558 [Trypanosoma cruzi]
MERNGICVRVRVYLTAVEANVRLLLRRGLWRSFCLLPCTSVLSSLSPGNSESTGACGAGLHAQRAWRKYTHTHGGAPKRGRAACVLRGFGPFFCCGQKRQQTMPRRQVPTAAVSRPRCGLEFVPEGVPVLEPPDVLSSEDEGGLGLFRRCAMVQQQPNNRLSAADKWGR